MGTFLLGYLCGIGTFVVFAAYAVFRDTPRTCAYPRCHTNHWQLGKYCSHHTLDQDDERYRC